MEWWALASVPLGGLLASEMSARFGLFQKIHQQKIFEDSWQLSDDYNVDLLTGRIRVAMCDTGGVWDPAQTVC